MRLHDGVDTLTRHTDDLSNLRNPNKVELHDSTLLLTAANTVDPGIKCRIMAVETTIGAE